MKFRDYFLTLDEKQQAAYAKRAKTTPGYIRSHLVSRNKIPRRKLLERLAKASRGMVSYREVLQHFYGEAAVDRRDPDGQPGHIV